MWDVRSILARPAVYRLFRKLVGGDSAERLVRDYIRPQPGERVLDIGCGPAIFLEALGPVDYVGFDHSADYIRQAQARFGDRGRFLHADVAADNLTLLGKFDLVLAIGVVHHLDDDEARKLFQTAQQALRPGGRLITFDGCFAPEQSAIARQILRWDRGRFVRNEAGYVRLAREFFPTVTADVRSDFIRIPYTHIILDCRTAAAAATTRDAA